jgi:hypothetical protein
LALFGKADEHLPILTKLYQLEFDPYTGEGDIEPFMISFLESQRRLKDPIPSLPKEINERASILRGIGYFVSLVKRVMQSVADKTVPSADDEFEINQLFEANVKPSVRFVFDGKTKSGEQKGFWALFNYVDFPEDYIEHPAKWVELLKLITLPNLLKVIDDGVLVRCSECKNVFPQTRKGQVYCSHRCSNRRSARTKKREKKENASV